MAHMRKTISTVAAAALLAASATPALADDHGHHGGGYGHDYGHHDDDHIGVGGVLAAIAVVGFIAAIASSSKSRDRSRQLSDNEDYNDPRYQSGAINSENAAVDACALAAEARAGKTSSVRDITKVAVSDDGWDIEGTVERRDDWRNSRADMRNFTCVVRAGSVKAVFVDINAVALR